MFDWKISVSAVLVLLITAALTHWLTKQRTAHDKSSAKIQEFRELLVPFIKALESPNANPVTIVLENFQAHDEAARKLALYLQESKKKNFLAAWNLYAEIYQEKKGLGLIGIISTQVDDLSLANPGNSNAMDYIRSQNMKRLNEIREAVTGALEAL
jgi:hypothetical protein